MIFYKHYIGDFNRDTGQLGLTERGAYLALIHHYYATEQPLPADLKSLYRIAGAFTKSEQNAVKTVLSLFENRGGNLWHKRIESELEKQADRCDKNRQIALSREARKRADKDPRIVDKSDHESCTNRGTNLPDSLHESSTNQNQNHSQLIPIQPAKAGSPVPVEPGPGGDATAKPKKQKPHLPNCPHQKLLDLWAKHLPHLIQPRVWDGQREACMRQRWVSAAHPSSWSPEGYSTESEGVAWWDSFFSYIAQDTKLANGFESNGRTWKPDLPWVLTAGNFQKIIDGKYDK